MEKKLGKIVLHIPAREGSKRVPRKNMRLMAGKPMIGYTIEAVLHANITSECYVNTDSEEIISYVETTYPNMGIYRRSQELCNDFAQSDHFNADIINKLQPDTLIMINPVCPLLEAHDIRAAVEKYSTSDCDTLVTATSTQMQTFCDGKPVNIDINSHLLPSQSNPKVTILNWAVSIWKAPSFLERMNTKGFGVWGEKIDFYDIEEVKAIKVSNETDFILAENLLKLRNER
jgi:CMP-N,N'-diacetyllegionaminic acid synthase